MPNFESKYCLKANFFDFFSVALMIFWKKPVKIVEFSSIYKVLVPWKLFLAFFQQLKHAALCHFLAKYRIKFRMFRLFLPLLSWFSCFFYRCFCCFSTVSSSSKSAFLDCRKKTFPSDQNPQILNFANISLPKWQTVWKSIYFYGQFVLKMTNLTQAFKPK